MPCCLAFPGVRWVEVLEAPVSRPQISPSPPSPFPRRVALSLLFNLLGEAPSLSPRCVVASASQLCASAIDVSIRFPLPRGEGA